MSVMTNKKRKLRKPRLEGWQIIHGSIWSKTPGVLHNKSGRWWTGVKRLEAMGNFFLKAAAWLREKEGGVGK